MGELELLKSIRHAWIQKAVQHLARGSGLREDLRQQLNQLFDLLEQVVETGDPVWLDPLLADWASSLTQTDLEGGQSNLSRFISELFQITLSVARENLDESQALDLIETLMPCFNYAFEKISQHEIQTRMAHLTNQLSEVQQTLEQLDRRKSDFIAVAAHELKTPLTLIEGYASMLRETTEQSNAQTNELILLDGIQNGTHRLHAIVDDMIDVSMIDNNLMELNFQPVWFNRLFAVLQLELIESISNRHQQLTIHPFPGSDELTFGDPDRLLQVFRNVFTNAIKFTPDGGKIDVDGRKLPGFLEVIVSDTGIGIDPEYQSLIFEKFIRLGSVSLHSSGKTKFKGGGPGLGLPIAKGIVEAHGGAIWAESNGYDEKNCPGATFHILLPLRNSPPDTTMAKLFESLTQPKTIDGPNHAD
ncbi:MAG TPA: HAMP domain-containing sensor histidine kinase [Anaerolineaceae bacterium]|nr:HAMP domain-containing sensor histidine kinase [Anaerolineaceae bacterium]